MRLSNQQLEQNFVSAAKRLQPDQVKKYRHKMKCLKKNGFL